jgi:V8-like Glu-specific endopeptidase
MPNWNLSADDFDTLVTLLADLPSFQTETRRWDFINDVLSASPEQAKIRRLLELSGIPRGAAVRVVTDFKQFGQDIPGREIIGILINKLLEGYIFDPEPVAFLRGLFDKYPLDKPVIASPPVDRWRGDDTLNSIREKIVGENTLRDVRLLELALEAAQAVVHLGMPNGMGSGFLVAPDLLITNHHVLPNAQVAAQTQYTFNYQLDRAGNPAPTSACRALPNGVFYTHAALDFSLIQLENPPTVPPLTLKLERLEKGNRAAIIQHPSGYYKKISMQNNQVQYADAQTVQYTTSTMPGSSGSPVFNEDFHVVAIHHSGGQLVDPGDRQVYFRNAGTSMIAIISDVRQNLPDVIGRLTVVS